MWAATLPCASHLATRMCIGHRENQLGVSGMVQTVTTVQPADRCSVRAYDSSESPKEPGAGFPAFSEFIPVGGERSPCFPCGFLGVAVLAVHFGQVSGRRREVPGLSQC